MGVAPGTVRFTARGLHRDPWSTDLYGPGSECHEPAPKLSDDGASYG